MASLRKRGYWWIKYRDVSGKIVERSLGTRDEARAREILREVESEVARQKAEAGTGPLTVAAYAERWLAARANKTAQEDASRVRTHVLPRLGDFLLAEVRRADVAAFVTALMAGGKLAPKTVLNVYGTLRVMLEHAVMDEMIKANPCTLDARRGELPLNRPARARYWEEESYAAAEVAALVWDPRVPEDRRVVYALKALAGLRVGEVCGLKVASWRRDMTPLSGLTIAASYSPKRKALGETKTGQARGVPVHPELAAILEAWLAVGWERMAGRAPTPEDWLVPARALTRREARLDPSKPRTYSSTLKRLHNDQRALGLRERNEHALRAFFVTWGAETSGVNEAVFRLLTHGRQGTIRGRYTRPQWESLCAEVLKLKLVRPGGDHAPVDSTELPHATRGASGQDTPGGSLPGGLPTPAAPASGRRAIGHPDGAPRDGSRDPAPAPLARLISAVTPEAQTSEGRGHQASDRANLPEGASLGTPSGREDAASHASRVQPAEWPAFVTWAPGRSTGAHLEKDARFYTGSPFLYGVRDFVQAVIPATSVPDGAAATPISGPRTAGVMPGRNRPDVDAGSRSAEAVTAGETAPSDEASELRGQFLAFMRDADAPPSSGSLGRNLQQQDAPPEHVALGGAGGLGEPLEPLIHRWGQLQTQADHLLSVVGHDADIAQKQRTINTTVGGHHAAMAMPAAGPRRVDVVGRPQPVDVPVPALLGDLPALDRAPQALPPSLVGLVVTGRDLVVLALSPADAWAAVTERGGEHGGGTETESESVTGVGAAARGASDRAWTPGDSGALRREPRGARPPNGQPQFGSSCALRAAHAGVTTRATAGTPTGSAQVTAEEQRGGEHEEVRAQEHLAEHHVPALALPRLQASPEPVRPLGQVATAGQARPEAQVTAEGQRLGTKHKPPESNDNLSGENGGGGNRTRLLASRRASASLIPASYEDATIAEARQDSADCHLRVTGVAASPHRCRRTRPTWRPRALPRRAA